MNAQTPSPSASAATPTLTADLISRLATAYGDSDSALTRRALAVHAAIAFGADVKSIARDMADANRADASIPAVSAATLGYAKFAGTVADMVGSSLPVWVKREQKMVADVIRAGKRVGVKAATAALREALHGIDGPVAREEIAGEVAARLLAGILPAATVQGPRSAGGVTDAPEPTEQAAAPVTVRAFTEADALAALRAVTHYLTHGGQHSADLASALAEVATAATAARKRTGSATRLAPVTAEPVAA